MKLGLFDPSSSILLFSINAFIWLYISRTVAVFNFLKIYLYLAHPLKSPYLNTSGASYPSSSFSLISFLSFFWSYFFTIMLVFISSIICFFVNDFFIPLFFLVDNIFFFVCTVVFTISTNPGFV